MIRQESTTKQKYNDHKTEEHPELTLHMQCILHEGIYTTSMAQPGIVLSPHAVKHLIWHPDHAMHSNLSQQAQDFVHRVIKTLEIHWVHIATYSHQTLEMHFPQITCSTTFAQACSNILSMLRCFELLHTHNSLIISTSCMQQLPLTSLLVRLHLSDHCQSIPFLSLQPTLGP